MSPCELCCATDMKVIATQMREGPGRICQCQKCDLVFQDLDFSDEDIEKYYNSEYERTNSLRTGKELSAREHFSDRIKTVGPFVDALRPYLKKDMQVLDVGCGAGEILESIKGAVAGVTGIELNKKYVDFMNQDLGIKAYAQDLKDIDFQGRKFDLILSLNALDHMKHPLHTLTIMKDLLTPNGFLYLMVPNRNEAMNFFLPEDTQKKFHAFFWHKAHFFYFTRETFSKMLEKAGFKGHDFKTLHQYTLVNFLQWYFAGSPQPSSDASRLNMGLFTGNSDFETRMNGLFDEMDKKFKHIINETFRGDILCCIATKI